MASTDTSEASSASKPASVAAPPPPAPPETAISEPPLRVVEVTSVVDANTGAEAGEAEASEAKTEIPVPSKDTSNVAGASAGDHEGPQEGGSEAATEGEDGEDGAVEDVIVGGVSLKGHVEVVVTDDYVDSDDEVEEGKGGGSADLICVYAEVSSRPELTPTLVSVFHKHPLDYAELTRWRTSYCDSCFSSTARTGDFSYCCKECEFDYCKSCVESERADRNAASQRRAAVEIHRTSLHHEHPLLSVSGSVLREHYCDVCTTQCFLVGRVMYRCAACDFDICLRCMEQERKRPAMFRRQSMEARQLREAEKRRESREARDKVAVQVKIGSLRDLMARPEHTEHAGLMRKLEVDMIRLTVLSFCLTIALVTFLVGGTVRAGRFAGLFVLPLIHCFLFVGITLTCSVGRTTLMYQAVALHWAVVFGVLILTVGMIVVIRNMTNVTDSIRAFCEPAPGIQRCSDPDVVVTLAGTLAAFAVIGYLIGMMYLVGLAAQCLTKCRQLLVPGYNLYTKPDLPWRHPKFFKLPLTVARLAESDSCIANVSNAMLRNRCSCVIPREINPTTSLRVVVLVFVAVYITVILLPSLLCQSDYAKKDDGWCIMLSIGHAISTGANVAA